MRRPRFQLRLSTLLWITLAVACWFGGAEWGWRRNAPKTYRGYTMGDPPDYLAVDFLVQPDGTKWFKVVSEGNPNGTMTFPNNEGATITVQGPGDLATSDEHPVTEGKHESPTWIYEQTNGHVIRRATEERTDEGTWRPVE